MVYLLKGYVFLFQVGRSGYVEVSVSSGPFHADDIPIPCDAIREIPINASSQIRSDAMSRNSHCNVIIRDPSARSIS